MYRRPLGFLLFICLLFGISVTASAKSSDFPVSAGSTFTGLDKIVYDRLKEEIENVASAQRTDTVFCISMEELGLDGSWTAEDLGVSVLVSNSSITSAAVDALYDKLSFDYVQVIHALLADLPFDLYWFDKATGYRLSFPPCTSNGRTIRFVREQPMTISLAVSQEYAQIRDDGSYDPYCLDPAAPDTFGVEDAAAKARRVVKDNAKKSDYEKLLAYRDYILNEVSFDHAVADDADYPYGNPWQVIYVFDGDDSTNVVCEGYAKAFKYLCDLSDFSGDIRCYLTSGRVYDGKETKEHLWNVIVMPNGKTYLVDMSNCDRGLIGYPDKLFMVGNDNTGSTADIEIIIPRHAVGNGTIAARTKLSYYYNTTTSNLWDSRILSVHEEDYSPCTNHKCDPEQVSFLWESDLCGCTAKTNCTQCETPLSAACQITTSITDGGDRLTITAQGNLCGYTVTDTRIVEITQDHLQLPELPTEDGKPSVMALIAGYESCGKLTFSLLAEWNGDATDCSFITGSRVMVYFLDADTWSPVLPALTAK